MKLGLSGIITRLFIRSPLTPLLLIAALAVGVAALLALPREEEPQISVPMVDIMVAANGVSAADAVELVTKPLEDIVKGIREVEHVYSLTEDDHVTVTARFFVGTEEDRAILRVHEELRANYHRIPVGIAEPMIVKRGINDVPIVTLTLSPRPDAVGRWDDHALRAVAEELNHELIKIDDVGRTFIVGGRHDQVRIEPDPERLALYGVTLNQLVDKVRSANRAFTIGRFDEGDRSLPVMAGQALVGIPDVGHLVITTRDGRPVYVKDVADIVVGASPSEQRVWHLVPAVDGFDRRPAVTLALAKRQGANAVIVAEHIHARVDLLRGSLLSPDLEVTLTRDYGQTADDKAQELLFHLGLATVSIVVLIAVALGWRAGVVVFVVVPTTILLTLFAAHLLGYTINRVSLFALIFSIGILVDDAIVIVENIVRHWRMGDGRSRMQAAIEGVAEVGNPTIVATLTIIVALLPMMFVSGLMGPYMEPIPAVASFAMAFSFFVAVAITPWLMMVMVGGTGGGAAGGGGHDGGEGRLGRLYRSVAAPLLRRRGRAVAFLAVVGVATLASCALFYVRAVTVKLLPFDNKPELQVVVDLPEGASLEATERALMAAAERLRDVPELTHIQLYAGTAAPFNFNGLVRHTYLRARPHQGELQINLLPKDERDRASHAIALDVRQRLAEVPLPAGTAVKVVEVPPGPPVLATLLAEVYGPDPDSRRAVAAKVRQAFADVDFIVDVDDTIRPPGDRVRFRIDQDNLEFHGVHEQAVYDTLGALIGGIRVGYSYRGDGKNPPEIVLRLPRDALTPGERLLTTPVAAPGPAGDRGANVELGDVVRMVREPASPSIFRRDGRFAEMVTAELAGRFEAPIYGMMAVGDAIRAMDWSDGGPPEIHLHGQPEDERRPSLLWDGEWEITYVTFRDMGLAFAAAIVGIYLLVVAQFQSFKLPLVVLTPIPLTLIGIVLGHWLFDAAFTATSMIGFIALAGIIVRNSILLVDFIRQRYEPGRPLRDVLLEAGAIRITPIVLTAAAAMIGAAFILTDPIFQGLAVSLVFGLASSTALTLLVIPAIYVTLRDDGRPASA